MESTMKLLVQNGCVHTMTGETPKVCDILIEDGKIKSVGEKLSIDDFKNITVWDATGCNVYPGFIESHCHVGISEECVGTNGDDCNELTNPITPYLRALDAVNPRDPAFMNAVRTGITTLMVGPGSSNPIGGQFLIMKAAGSNVIDDLVVKEPAAMKLAFGENPKTQFGNNDKTPCTRMAIAAMIRKELTAGKEYWQQKKEAARKNEYFKIDFNKECWIPVFEKKIPLKCHAHRADDIMTAIRIAKEFDVLMTIDHCSEGHVITDHIKKSGFPAIVGPSYASRSKVELIHIDFSTVSKLQKAGVLVSIMTDHPVTLIQSLPLCAGLAVKRGLEKEEALKAITINAAKILGIDDLVGTVEVGKDADIAIYQGDPLEINSTCIGTIIRGEICFDIRDSSE